jgi:hypothetical protein
MNNIYVLQGGIFDNSTIPSVDAISFAATLLPTIKHKLGAIKCFYSLV